jgi:outer membrane lipoprotein-sorting protein
MRKLATLPTRRLWAIAVAVVLVAAGGVGIAQAALGGGGAKPDPKPLDVAVHDALTAPQVKGITARIKFTNGLLPSGTAVRGPAATPLLTGASGRLWLAGDGRARVELQSDNGDAQIVVNGRDLTVYDAGSNTVYQATLPEQKDQAAKPDAPPSVGDVKDALAKLAQTWQLSGAQPTNTAGQPSYTVHIAPKDDGGLLGAAEVAWDAARGVPLRAAIYAQGQAAPVLELKATDIGYGPIALSDLEVAPPSGAKVEHIDLGHAGAGDHTPSGTPVQGASAVAKALDFPLAAPADLAGLPRKDVRLVTFGGGKAALSTYGKGLGAILVLQRKADPAKSGGAAGRQSLELPSVNIDGATGKELATALGTVVTFQRGGVSYTVAGSVPPVAAENAARGLK